MLAQTCVHRVSDAIQPSYPLSSLLLLPLVFPSNRVFSSESVLHIRWPKYWSFSISPSNEYSGLISFRIDWFDLFAIQGTLKSLLQHHSSKASILWCSAFFMVQLTHPYMITGKTIALTRWTFVGKVSQVTQSCPTLCDPLDCSLQGSSIHKIFQVRILEWVVISFSRDLPNPGIEPWSPTLQTDTLPSEPPGKPWQSNVSAF